MTSKAKSDIDPDYRSPAVPCATSGCPHGARHRVRRKMSLWDRRKKPRYMADTCLKPNPIQVAVGPWLNLCDACEIANVKRESIEYCKLMVLDTPAKQRAWCVAQGLRPR